MSVKIGRVVLNEGATRSFEETWSDTGRDVTLSGIQYSTPPSTRAQIAAMHDDILGLPQSLVAVTFDVKDHRNGYYLVTGSRSSMIELPSQSVIQLGWEVSLRRVGNDQELDLESRLAGPVNRLNDHELPGSRWHAPSGSAAGYFAGFSTPGEVARLGGEGPITVYVGMSEFDNPRWYCPVEEYGVGRARVVDLSGERSGVGVDLDLAEWELNNSLIAWMANPTGTFDMFVHNGTEFGDAKSFNLTLNDAPLGMPLAVSILHNEFERVTVRVMWDRSPSGRVYADFTLRRGARFVEIVIRANVAGSLGVVRASNEAGFAGSGYVRATSNDADGNRYVIGSRKTFTNDLTAGGIEMASSTLFDVIVGAEVGGAAAVTGDQAGDLMAQYVGTPEERVQGVRR